MAGEQIYLRSNWVIVISSAAVGSGFFSAASNPLSGTPLSANEQSYVLTDFELVVTANAATENEAFELYRIARVTPAGGYRQQLVGKFVLDDATGSYRIYGVDNADPDDTYVLRNDGSGSVTASMNQRTRTRQTVA